MTIFPSLAGHLFHGIANPRLSPTVAYLFLIFIDGAYSGGVLIRGGDCEIILSIPHIMNFQHSLFS